MEAFMENPITTQNPYIYLEIASECSHNQN